MQGTHAARCKLQIMQHSLHEQKCASAECIFAHLPKGRDFANELSECITYNNYPPSWRLTCIGCRNPSSKSCTIDYCHHITCFKCTTKFCIFPSKHQVRPLKANLRHTSNSVSGWLRLIALVYLRNQSHNTFSISAPLGNTYEAS